MVNTYCYIHFLFLYIHYLVSGNAMSIAVNALYIRSNIYIIKCLESIPFICQIGQYRHMPPICCIMPYSITHLPKLNIFLLDLLIKYGLFSIIPDVRLLTAIGLPLFWSLGFSYVELMIM